MRQSQLALCTSVIAVAVLAGGAGSRQPAGMTRLGDAKIAIDRWAKDLRSALDDAHGR